MWRRRCWRTEIGYLRNSGGGVKAGTTVIRKVTPESLMPIYPRLLSSSGFLPSKPFLTTPLVSCCSYAKIKFKSCLLLHFTSNSLIQRCSTYWSLESMYSRFFGNKWEWFSCNNGLSQVQSNYRLSHNANSNPHEIDRSVQIIQRYKMDLLRRQAWTVHSS